MQQTSPMIGAKDGRQGRIGSITSQGLGATRPLYNKAYEEDEEDLGEEELFIRDEIRKQISSVINPHHNTAIGIDQSRTDKASLTSPNHAFLEENGTQARSGISPFSNRQLYPNGLGPVLGVGGADQAFRTTGNFQHIGSESGYVDPGTIMFNEDDEPLYDIRDIDDPMERSFKKHQKSVKLVLDKINECLRDI
mgnify:CR=1 FL=1